MQYMASTNHDFSRNTKNSIEAPATPLVKLKTETMPGPGETRLDRSLCVCVLARICLCVFERGDRRNTRSMAGKHQSKGIKKKERLSAISLHVSVSGGAYILYQSREPGWLDGSCQSFIFHFECRNPCYSSSSITSFLSCSLVHMTPKQAQEDICATIAHHIDQPGRGHA